MESQNLESLLYTQKYDQLNLFVKTTDFNPVSVNIFNMTPLHVAILLEDLELVKILLPVSKKTEEICDSKGLTPLKLAFETKNEEILSYLIESAFCGGFDGGISDESIRWVYFTGCITAMEFLEANNISIDRVTTPVMNPLMSYVVSGNKKALSYCLRTYPEIPTHRFLDGGTILHFAARYASDPLILCAILDSEQCNPNTLNNQGLSALHVAIESRNSASLHVLMYNSKVDKNILSSEGQTPLMFSLQQENNVSYRSFIYSHDVRKVYFELDGTTRPFRKSDINPQVKIEALRTDPEFQFEEE